MECQESESDSEPEELPTSSSILIPESKTFKNFEGLFQNLLKMKNVQSMHPIMNCLISYDSTRVITVTMASNSEYWLQMYDLETH